MKTPRIPGNALLIIVTIVTIYSCREINVPRPKGHFRIDLPAKEYREFNVLDEDKALPFSFEYPVYGKISPGTDDPGKQGWFNIEFPAYKAKIYLTYMKVGSDFNEIMEQTYRMNVKNHITRADAISEKYYSDTSRKVYGILYDLKGNTATAVQFYLTDSVKHYLRGSLYFDAEPDEDSLSPVIDFFRADIEHLAESLRWKH
jgi:gliding motility-associated lipoprotein GldD